MMFLPSGCPHRLSIPWYILVRRKFTLTPCDKYELAHALVSTDGSLTAVLVFILQDLADVLFHPYFQGTKYSAWCPYVQGFPAVALFITPANHVRES